MSEKWQSDDGRVTLYLGDSFQVLNEIPANYIDVIITDPPYMMEGHVRRSKGGQPSKCDTLKGSWNESNPTDVLVHYRRICKDTSNIAMFHDRKSEPPINGFTAWSNMYLVKKNPSPRFRPGFCSSVEACTIYRKTGTKIKWHGSFKKKSPNFMLCDRCRDSDHPAKKPIEIINYLMSHLTAKDDLVLDPFMGGGVTGVSCAMLGRRFIGVELDKEYFESAKKRIITAGALRGDMEGKVQPLLEVCGG